MDIRLLAFSTVCSFIPIDLLICMPILRDIMRDCTPIDAEVLSRTIEKYFHFFFFVCSCFPVRFPPLEVRTIHRQWSSSKAVIHAERWLLSFSAAISVFKRKGGSNVT